jgi:hypothetical protein
MRSGANSMSDEKGAFRQHGSPEPLGVTVYHINADVPGRL